MRLRAQRVDEEEDGVHGPNGGQGRDLGVAAFRTTQQLLDGQTDLPLEQSGRVARGDQLESVQHLAIEGRPGQQVDLLVVVRDQRQRAHRMTSSGNRHQVSAVRPRPVRYDRRTSDR